MIADGPCPTFENKEERTRNLEGLLGNAFEKMRQIAAELPADEANKLRGQIEVAQVVSTALVREARP